MTMKRLTILFLTLLLLAGCAKSQDDIAAPDQPAVSAEEDWVFPLYANLSYSGMDTNPGHTSIPYQINDQALVTTVLQTLQQDSWTPADSTSDYMTAIDLEFHNGNGFNSFAVTITPTDQALVDDDRYTMPQGTYETVSALLYAYSEEHFNTLDAAEAVHLLLRSEGLRIAAEAVPPISVAAERLDLYIGFEAADLQPLEAALQVERWEPATIPDGEYRALSIYTSYGDRGTDLVIYLDDKYIALSKDGVSASFQVDEDIIAAVVTEVNTLARREDLWA